MYSITNKVRYSECNTDSVLTIPALINYFQDCSTFHTESIGHGIEHCAKNHFAWFVAAWQIGITRLPRFCESIEVSTYSYAARPTMAHRNFVMATTDGETLVEADSLWFPFDTVKERPIRIPESENVLMVDEVAVSLPPTRRKLKLTGQGRELAPIVVTEHHLDTNRHVNNGQYIAMANDLVLASNDEFSVSKLYVQYKNAAKLGDTILPYLYEEETGFAVDLTDGQGTSYAVVRMQRAE